MVVKMATRKSKKAADAVGTAPVAAAPTAPERVYTFGDYCSGWIEGRIGYERQQAALAKARAARTHAECGSRGRSCWSEHGVRTVAWFHGH